jgi:hypothetical protein
MLELTRFLQQLRWRYRLLDSWLLAQRSLAYALAVGALVLLAGRFLPFEGRLLWSVLPLAAWLLFMLAVFALRPYPYLRVARRADEGLNLYERLSTAWVLGQDQPPAYASYPADWVHSQRQDAIETVASLQPAEVIPLPFLRRPWMLSGGLLVAILALALLPNPMDAIIAQRRAVEQAAAAQAEQVEKLAEQIQENTALSETERQELARQLSVLAEQLRNNSGDLEEALADLSRMQQALQARLDPNAANRQANLADLARQLQALAGTPYDPQDSAAETAAEALQQLAEQIEQMTPDQRSASAGELGRMAAQAAQSGDAQLAQALSSLSQAMQANNASAAQNSLQQAQQALADAQQIQDAQAALQQALSNLQNSQQSLAQASQSAQANAQPGSQPAQQPGSQPGQSPGNAPGQSPGNAPGQAPGQSPGSGQPGGGGGTTSSQLPPGTSSGQAGRPQGYKPGSAGELGEQVYAPWSSAAAAGEELFIPGQDTSQGQTSSSEGSSPTAGAGSSALMPYYQVYYDYFNAANQSIQQGAIPAGLADYVRAYFSQLEP